MEHGTLRLKERWKRWKILRNYTPPPAPPPIKGAGPPVISVMTEKTEEIPYSLWRKGLQDEMLGLVASDISEKTEIGERGVKAA